MRLKTALARLDWPRLTRHIEARGFAVTEPFLGEDDCRAVRRLYGREDLFRSRVVMSRHGFGEGEYQYFAYPLPSVVETLRRECYGPLAAIANRWEQMLGRPASYPQSLEAYLAACHAAEQTKPTPLLLRYRPGDFNRLHQDLYGPLHFPLQVAILLSKPGPTEGGGEFEGGEFVLTEQRPRIQSRVQVVPLQQGQAVIFSVNQRPVQGARGPYRVAMRHGVSEVRAGERYTLGVIFHDAA